MGTTKPKGSTRIGQRDRTFSSNGIMHSLEASGYKQPPQILVQNKGESQHYRLYDTEGLSPTLQSQNGKVRKLMPIECERLMSWPDDWVRWGINEKGVKIEISDSQRYKMCGNGVVSNIVREIIKNLF